jgi:hypothetical protein
VRLCVCVFVCANRSRVLEDVRRRLLRCSFERGVKKVPIVFVDPYRALEATASFFFFALFVIYQVRRFTSFFGGALDSVSTS